MITISFNKKIEIFERKPKNPTIINDLFFQKSNFSLITLDNAVILQLA